MCRVKIYSNIVQKLSIVSVPMSGRAALESHILASDRGEAVALRRRLVVRVIGSDVIAVHERSIVCRGLLY